MSPVSAVARMKRWRWLWIHDRETTLIDLIQLLNLRLKALADFLAGGGGNAGDEINAAEAYLWNDGDVLVAGQSDWLFVPFDFTIDLAEIVTDYPGTLEVAVYASSYSAWDGFTLISALAPVRVSGTDKAHSPITGWTRTFTGGTYLRFDIINTPAVITKATVTLYLSVPNSVLVSASGELFSGSAGGVLSGTYPNPGFAEDMATQAELDLVEDASIAADVALDTRLDIVEAALPSLASLSYVDAKVAGLSWKQAVRAATTAAGTLATSFENGDAIDGVTLATGDRILVKNQATAAENGIYIVAASGAPTRATDADAGAELVNATVYVSEGSTLADTQWTCTTNAPITVGTTALAFAQLSAGGVSSLTVKDEGSALSTAVTSIDVVGESLTATNVGGAVTLTGLRSKYQIWDPFVPDASPHADTDEFTSNTIANWTGVYTGDAGVVSDIATSLAHGMYFETPTVQYRMRSRMKAIIAGDFTIHTAVDPIVVSQGDSVWTGIILADGVTAGAGLQTAAAFNRDAGATMYKAGRLTWAKYGFDATSANASQTRLVRDAMVFIRLRRVSGVYSMAFSSDGENYPLEQTITMLSSFTPTHMGLFLQNYIGSGVVGVAAYKFFRVYATGTQMKTGALRTIYG